MTDKSSIRFRHFIIIPLCIALVGILLTAAGLIHRLEQTHIEKNVTDQLKSVREISQSLLASLSNTLSGALGFIQSDRRLQNAWMARDRNAILTAAGWIYQNILLELGITHFYFIQPSKVCFLRIHKPEYCGDIIRRSTLDRAERSKTAVSGLELGPLGTLTYRQVHPWRIDGQQTGYIELGVEIDNMATRLKELLGCELIFTVRKAYLDRDRWEEGLRMMGRTGDWDRFPRRVIISQTLQGVPAEVGHYMQEPAQKNPRGVFNVAYQSREYRGGLIPLVDARDRVIGDIIVLTDVTAETGLLQELNVLLLVSGATGFILIALFYLFVGRIERNLGQSQDSLTREIGERRRAQAALQQAYDDMETRVEEATSKLKRVNEQLRRQVSECEAAEGSLRESEEKYRALVEDALTAVYIVQDGRIRFVNDTFADIFGYDRRELTGVESLKLIHSEDRKMVARIREKRLDGKAAPSVYEVRGIRKNGDTIWLLRSNTVIRYREKPAIAGNVIDITDRKEAEAMLRQSVKEHRILSSRLLSAEENERKRIAREVHDSIGQSLSAIKYSLENAISAFGNPSRAPDPSLLEAMVPIAQQSIEEVRRITMDLRPSILDDLGIRATINWFCREFQSVYANIAIDKEITATEAAIPVLLKTAIYRILQEALNNAAKHAGADHVMISLKARKGRVELQISDNGVGMDVDRILSLPLSERGFGLASMRERVELSGGEFDLHTHPGRGTRIQVAWPRETAPETPLS